MDAGVVPGAAGTSARSVSDEVRGLRATGSLVAGDFEDAVAELEQTSSRYLAGFFLRLAIVTQHRFEKLHESGDASDVLGRTPPLALDERRECFQAPSLVARSICCAPLGRSTRHRVGSAAFSAS